MAADCAAGSTAVPNVLSVAGSDSGAGAGMQADLKTFAALGVYGCTAVTAITAQNTVSVQRIVPVAAAMVEAQMEAVLGDVRIAAIKLGLLPTASVVRAVARVLARHPAPDVVYDPVMAASTGRSLHSDSALAAVRNVLLARVTVVTPNVAELVRLTGMLPVRTDDDLDRAARRLLDAGPEWVLVTGGDRPGRFSRDRLHGPRGSGTARWYRARRIATRHGHGTGCTLSSAIAARLARGDAVPTAVEAAKSYLGGALAAADELDAGTGAGPLNHFHAMWRQT
ncbi:MAG: bifunctional hydroxymethylpyrimidine kinase/phosphomethylpyrimidine kinase [Immundisolibacterales bacterium]|nr:bifunctional hydroxymethylpyrimidine kinase/phosphomethylpyrimidine kinase [Immundisolibacterales bacterium]